jgi:hypothetical protein
LIDAIFVDWYSADIVASSMLEAIVLVAVPVVVVVVAAAFESHRHHHAPAAQMQMLYSMKSQVWAAYLVLLLCPY